MKAKLMAAGVLALMVGGVLAQTMEKKGDAMMGKGSAVRFADLKGKGMYAKLSGTVVIVTKEDGTHRFFLEGMGLPEKASVQVRLHTNMGGNASCANSNGDKVISLTAFASGSKGMGQAVLSVPATIKYPEGAAYISLLFKNEVIACGQLEGAGGAMMDGQMEKDKMGK